LSNNTVARRIKDISIDIEKQLTSAVFTSTAFPIQIDESCDISSVCHLVGYVIFSTVKAYFNKNQLTFDGMQFCTTDGAATDYGAVIWDVNVDPSGYLDNLTITKGSATNHAIQFGANIPSSVTINNGVFSGFNASDNQYDSTFYFAGNHHILV